jgi:hypothetical protein
MSDKPFDISISSRSSGWLKIWPVIFVLGLVGWLLLISQDPARAWRAFLINFIFFTPLAAGMITWPAVVFTARGQWMGPAQRPAMTGLGFAPFSLLAFIALWIAGPSWAPWFHDKNFFQMIWLNPTFLFTRDFLAILFFWILAWQFNRRQETGRPKILAAWLVVVYCAVFSLLGFDLVMALDPRWFSSLFGGYFFISGMYIAVAAWTFLAVRRPGVTRDQCSDLGKLIVTFGLLTTYLMFSQLIPIWYENLPAEVRFVVPRMNFRQWQWVSIALLGIIYLGPLVFLLTRWSKKTPRFLQAVAFAVLVGMWVERWWLVAPTFNRHIVFGPTEVAITTAFLAAFAFSVLLADRKNSKIPGQRGQP